MPPRDDNTSVVRQLKTLVVVLILSNIALGVFGFYLLRTIDRNYSVLIDQSIPILNGLQTLTAKASEAMRSTNPVLLTEGKVTPDAMAKDARAAISRGETVREDILKRN